MSTYPAVPFLKNQWVSIKTFNKTYWTFVNGGGLGGQSTCFHTDAKQVNGWEKFVVEVVDATNLKFALKTLSGFYITANNGGGMGGANDGSNPVHTDATNLNVWERVYFERQTDGTYALRTQNGFYLTCMDQGGHQYDSQPFSSNRKVRGDTETFTAMPLLPFLSVRLAFKTPNGRYITAVNNGGYSNADISICTGRKIVGNYEKFYIEVVDAGANKFALRTSGGYYITFVNGGGIGGPNDITSPIHTDAALLNAWEEFVVEPQNDGTHAFRTNNGGYYLTAVAGGGVQPKTAQPVTSVATTRGANEVFTAVYY